jgi:iron complex transport system substrate-binding protein
MVVALGVERKLVGMADPVDTTAEVRRAVADVPRVGSLESILELRPDVVLGLGVVRERDPELVQRLRERGVEVHLADPATLEDVYSLTRTVAERTGSVAAGEQLVKRLQARWKARPPIGSVRRRRVFVYDCCDPPFTAGGRAVLSDLIRRAGGRNVFADVDADWTHVSWEQVLDRHPDLIVVHQYREGAAAEVEGKRQALAKLRALADLPVAVVPLGCSLGGLRSLEGLERLAAALRPPRAEAEP